MLRWASERVLRRVLDLRHVGYVAAAALSLIGLVRANGVVAWAAGTALVVVAVVWAAEFQTKALRRRRRADERVRRIQSEVKDLRGALSRQAQTLEVLGTVAEQARAAAEREIHPTNTLSSGRGDGPRVLFVTSNGSGMGHLTRLMAIANAGRERFESSFVSLSAAAEIVARFGYRVERVAGQSASDLSWPEWNRRFARFIQEHVATTAPDAIVFDGIHVFRGLHEVADGAGVPLIWVCRGLWKESTSRVQLRRWRDVAHAIVVPTERPILPDDAAIPEAVDGIELVDPIVLLDARSVLSRTEAKARLGLDPERRHVLVQVGSGALGSRSEIERVAIEAVRSLGREWEPIVFRSPLSSDDAAIVFGARVVCEYPMSALLRAFEFSITSAGYNTVHENLRFAHPTIYVADRSMLTDDQARRAEAVAEEGLGLSVLTHEELAGAVSELASDDRRARMLERLADIETPDGALAVADTIVQAIGVRRRLSRSGLVREGFLPMEMGVQ